VQHGLSAVVELFVEFGFRSVSISYTVLDLHKLQIKSSVCHSF